ncbi:MAG: metallophosphoesterase [Chthoniobacterales bacterium]
MPVNRRAFLRLTGATIAAGLAASTAGDAAMFEPNNLVLERKRVPLPKLPDAFDGFRIVLLADFHLHPFTTANLIRRTVEISNALKPDLVLLGGDYVCSSAEAAFELGPILENLEAKHGIFAVLGNYDHYRGARIVLEGLRRASIPVLMNEGVRLTVGEASIFLAGIDSVCAGQPNPRAAFSARKNEAVSLVLVHEPDYINQLSTLVPVDLQLSGHTHGGQVRLPGFGAVILPPWGQAYVEGLYRVGTSQVYTSRGIGMVGVPFRLNCPPEVTEITLVQSAT